MLAAQALEALPHFIVDGHGPNPFVSDVMAVGEQGLLHGPPHSWKGISRPVRSLSPLANTRLIRLAASIGGNWVNYPPSLIVILAQAARLAFSALSKS